MPTRNVVLTDHQAGLIEELVGSGRYQNASEVLREGLRLVEQQENENALRLHALRAAIDLGIADLDEGRFEEFSTAEALNARLVELTADALKGL